MTDDFKCPCRGTNWLWGNGSGGFHHRLISDAPAGAKKKQIPNPERQKTTYFAEATKAIESSRSIHATCRGVEKMGIFRQTPLFLLWGEVFACRVGNRSVGAWSQFSAVTKAISLPTSIQHANTSFFPRFCPHGGNDFFQLLHGSVRFIRLRALVELCACDLDSYRGAL